MTKLLWMNKYCKARIQPPTQKCQVIELQKIDSNEIHRIKTRCGKKEGIVSGSINFLGNMK